MFKMLLYFILILLLSNPVLARKDDKDDDKQSKLTIMSISQSTSSTIRPISAGTRGGTPIYIRYSGKNLNSNNVNVYVGNFPCLVDEGGVSDTHITCETTDTGSTNDMYNLYVTVVSKGKTYTTTSSDYVNFYNSMNSQVDEIFPSAGFARSTVHFYGSNSISNIGDGKDTGDVKKLMVGKKQCNMIDVAQPNYNSYLKCIQSSQLEAGNYNITQKLKNGYANKSPFLRRASLNKNQYFEFTHLPTVSSVSQSSGQEGGQRLTIKGKGFSKTKANNSVSIDGNPCIITQIQDDDQIKCRLPPKNNSLSAKLPTNSTNQTNGYFSGAGLSYARYAGMYSSLDAFIQSVRTGSPIGSLEEKGFRAELREYTYANYFIGEYWKGYFTAPVAGNYTFRGLAQASFKMFLSNLQGSAELPDTPLIYSYNPFQRWNSFYYDDIYTAEKTVFLNAGKSYYLEAYHVNQYTNYFKISVDVPNNDTTLPYQAFQVHRLVVDAEVQPEVVVYSMTGPGYSNSTITLRAIRRDDNNYAYYNVSVTISYGCQASSFLSALNQFDAFYPYLPSVVRKMYDSSGNLTDSVLNASRIDYIVSLYLLRDVFYQQENFIVTRKNYNGVFSKNITIEHSPLITGNFSLRIGGVNLNNGSISYAVSQNDLQNYFRTIKGYEQVEVESKTVYGCGYSCVWVISYKGVHAPIPNITLSPAKLLGGNSFPTVNLTVRRYYSPSITFEPIDYRFLNTASNVSNVLVTTNGLPSVCTGNCTYVFKKAATIRNLSMSSNDIYIGISNTTAISLSDITITLNDIPCNIKSGSTLSNLTCSITRNTDGSLPLTAGQIDLQVLVKSIGIIQPEPTVSPLVILLVASSINSTSGGMNGGTINRIFGGGFSMNTSQISITVCSKPATIKSSTFSQITFYMPSCEVAGNYTVTVFVGNTNASFIVYEYLAPSGPTITYITPNSSNPTAKKTLTIVGTGFGTNQSEIEVFLSNYTGKVYQLKIMNFTNTTIVVGLSGGIPGTYTVQVTKEGQGDSLPSTSGVDQFKYEFAITSVSPSSGSYYGGTLLTITGTNFSPASGDTLVYIGYTLNWFCNIESITTTQILCRTPEISPDYQIVQQLDVVISTKLYMLSSCPNNNCKFSYTNSSISPFISSISSTVVSKQNISLFGQKFNTYDYTGASSIISSANGNNPSFQVVLYSFAGNVQSAVITPTVFNDTYASFSVSSTLPTGDYKVRIRNGYGESNFFALKRQWNIGGMNQTYGSTQGNIISFTGGYGYPAVLSNSYYVNIYNNADGFFYKSNVISCCENNTAIIAIPATANGLLIISFMTPSNSYNSSYSVNSTYNPKLMLISSAIVNPGSNTITIQRNDTLTPLITSIRLVSTINSQDIITVASFTTNSSQHRFTVNLTSGSYRIVAFTSMGYCEVNSTISVRLKNGSTISSKPASFAGDQVTIYGEYLSPSSYIEINGFIGNIASYTPNAVTYRVPTISAASLEASIPTTKPSNSNSRPKNDEEDSYDSEDSEDSEDDGKKKVSSSRLTCFSDQTSSSSNAASVLDGDRKTKYISPNQDCWIGVDIGLNLAVKLDKIRFFPNMDWSNVVSKLILATFEGSNNMSNWIKLGTVGSNARHGWNTIKVDTNTSFRYIRMKHNSTSQCSLAELEIYGKIFTSVTPDPSSYPTTVTYKDGYNSYNFSNALQFRIDRTPIVTSVAPEFGDIFGGYNITLYGSYLNFGLQSILIDSIPCLVVSSNSTQINCTVGSRPSNYSGKPSFRVTVNGSSAVINKSFFYVLKWSDARTWGVDLPPIDGDLIYVPAGMTLLVDQSTPNLLGIAAQNATIIFPKDKDINVTAGFITIVGGSFIAGRQSDPFMGNLKIILTGDYYGKQQPTFGNKGIGCLDCKLSIYGKPRNPTWTTLAVPLYPGESSFMVSVDVDWKVGESIVVASTSFDHNQAEQRVIVAKSGRNITVATPFNYQHLSTIEYYGPSDKLVMRAEVGLLSRNIQIMGDSSTPIGKYGPHVMATSTSFNSLEVHIAYVQLFQCGQPQIPGRHCIFFNMAKDVPRSFVRGNSIHESYGKMIALYGTSYLTVEDNVGFKNKGHNIFLQSGIQTNNTIKKNLIISSLSSSSMLQTDQSPASLWITHPTNDIYGNHLAGGDYYGMIYQTGDQTNSPSDMCTSGSPLGLVADNVIHSNQQFGLRIIKLISRTYPCSAVKYQHDSDDLWTSTNNPSIASVFHNFTIYKNKDEGVWAEEIGHLVINNFTVADNKVAGMEFQTANFTREMVSVNNSIVIGQSQLNFDINSLNFTGMAGVITPRTGQSNLTNVRLYNFPSSTASVVTCAKCNIQQYFTNVGTEVFFKNVKFLSIDGQAVSMYGGRRDIIYDTDGSVSTYFFSTHQTNGTLVNSFPHITFSSDRCRTSNSNAWNALAFCSSSTVVRRIMITNAIGAQNWYDLYWTAMYVMPITNVSSTAVIDYSITTGVGMTYPNVEKPQSWSLPYIAGMIYQIWWSNNADFNHISLTTTPMYGSNEPGVVFKFPYTMNRQLFNVGPMRSYIFPSSSQMLYASFDSPDPQNCTNGQYYHVNDVGSRMLSICQSGKNKTKYQYTEVNAIYCKYVCPTPPLPALPSSAGIIVKESFVRFWSNASMWPNGTIPAAGQDVYINGNWTVLIDMDPNPIKYMIVDGALIADDTRDIYISAQSIHIRAGSITAGSSSAPFIHKFTIQVNNTANADPWTIDDMISGNKFLVVTGTLNLYGKPPATTWTYLKQTALAGDKILYVASQGGWAVGDSIVLSPSLGKYDEFERVTIQAINPDGSINITSLLKYNHYGSLSSMGFSHGNLDFNTQVGHLERNIKIISGPDTSYGMDFIVYGYWDDKMNWIGSVSLSGVQVEGANGIRYQNVLGGSSPSSITFSSFAESQNFFADLQYSSQITMSNNVFYRSNGFGVSTTGIRTFNFTSNLMIGVQDSTSGCFSASSSYISPTSDISIKENFCLGSAGYGFSLPLIKCTDLEDNPMANNTVGSAKVGFVLNNIRSSDYCKAFSYIKAYGCKIGQITNPTDTSKLIFEHFTMADNERAVTLKFADQTDNKQHTAELSYSSISAVSRPDCQICYGQGQLSCKNNIGVQLLSVTTKGSSAWYDISDEISSAGILLSTAFIKSVVFDNFRKNYTYYKCQNNFIFRPHRQAHDAVAMHSVYDSSCTNCDSESFLLADPNDASLIGWMGGCGDIACTGKSNYLVIDWDGTLFGTVGTLVPNNPQIGQYENCTYISRMNAHFCNKTDLTVLGYQSTASDYNTRIMWPVDLFYEGSNYTTTVNGWREWEYRNNVPQNRRLGRFLSIIKFNTTYNITFKSMPPANMDFQMQKRRINGGSFNYIIVKVKYPVPNLIRITANTEIVNPILLVDGGLKRPLNTAICGDNIYYFTNYTTNFVMTEDNCMITMELVETVQLTTHFAMKPEDFFANTVMSSFIDNLCALLGVTDTSRIKVVGVYSGSTIVKTMILPPIVTVDNSTNSTSNGTSSNFTLSSTEPSLAQVQQTLASIIQNGSYSGTMLNSTGYEVITSTSVLYQVPSISNNSESSDSVSIPMLAGIVVGGLILIIITIGVVIHCLRKNNVDQELDESVHQEKEIVPSDSIIFSNDVMVEVPEKDDSPPLEQKKANKVTNNMRRNKRLARNNNNNNNGGLQVREINNKDYFDFEQ